MKKEEIEEMILRFEVLEWSVRKLSESPKRRVILSYLKGALEIVKLVAEGEEDA